MCSPRTWGKEKENNRERGQRVHMNRQALSNVGRNGGKHLRQSAAVTTDDEIRRSIDATVHTLSDPLFLHSPIGPTIFEDMLGYTYDDFFN
jgi:hypothetical protein